VAEAEDLPALLGCGPAEPGDRLTEPSFLVGDLLGLGADAR
jgi:hypothetical protein